VSLPLPTGAATSALQTQPGVDIGDVTVNNAAGAGAVNIQDGGNSITVDGAVTANIGTTGDLALNATLTGGTTKAIVRGGAKGATTAADVTSTSQSVDRQALDVQIRTSAGAAVDTFGSSTEYDDGDLRGTATGVLAMGDDGTNIQSLNVDTSGRLNINTQFGKPTTASLSSVSINAAANGNNTLIAAVGGQTIRVFKMFMVAAANVDVILRDGAATDLTGVMSLSKYGSVTLDLDGEPWFITAAGNAFVINLSAATQMSGRIYYTQS
jgi:hypothetical protein